MLHIYIIMIRFMSTEIDDLGIHYGNIDRQNHECKSRAVPPNYLTKYLSSYLLTGMTEPITGSLRQSSTSIGLGHPGTTR